jgi:uncharacterized membrane protein
MKKTLNTRIVALILTMVFSQIAAFPIVSADPPETTLISHNVLSNEHDFGTVGTGYSTPNVLNVRVTNTGDVATSNLTVAPSGAGAGSFTLSTDELASIASPGFSTFTVVPNDGLSVGTYTATVTINGSNVEPISFTVTFRVIAAHSISISPSNHTLDSRPPTYTTSPVHTVTITNTGALPTGELTVALVAVAGTNPERFRLNETQSTITIPSIAIATGNNTATFNVRPITGLGSGTHTARIDVSGANIQTQHFTVSFTVSAARSISLSPSGNQTFPDVTVGYGNQTARTITVTNTGSEATGQLTVELTGSNAATNFELSRTTIPSIAATGNTTSATFTVRPRTGRPVGTHTATVRISGDGIPAQTFTVSFTVESGTVEGRSITLSTTGTHTFPSREAGYGNQTAHTVTITNNGTQATGELTIALSGTNRNSFTLNHTSRPSIARNGTTTFTVRPNTGLSNGTYNATVTVSGGSGITSRSFNVRFTVGVEDDDDWGVTLSTTGTHTFPSRDVGYNAQTPHTITVTNNYDSSTGPLTIALSGTNRNSFTLSRTSLSSIAVNRTATFTVVPNTGLNVGTYNATVTVSGDDIESKSFNIRFTVNQPSQFFDVSPNEWYASYVNTVVSEGLFLGTGNGQFSPNLNMSRAMFTQVVANLEGVNLSRYNANFLDVSPNDWFFSAVGWASSVGFVSGVGGGNFAPNAAITREQIAVMLYRYAEIRNIDLPKGSSNSFADQHSISTWAVDAVDAIQAAGIITGRPNNMFAPQATATRAEVAAIFSRFLEII